MSHKKLSKINLQRIKKLISVLESNEYKKAKGTLCTVRKNGSEKFCVEGVMCDLYKKSVKSGEWKPCTSGLPEKAFVLLGERYYSSAPSEVCKYFFGESFHLFDKNDAGWSFKRISQYLRDKYEIS